MRSIVHFMSLSIILLLPFNARTQEITGTIKDATSGDPLPFATVALKGTRLGTVCNAAGSFFFRLPKLEEMPVLQFSYVGYELLEVELDTLEKLSILLTPSIQTLKEVVVRPLSPEEYIKQAVKKIADNYSDAPFGTHAYYREKVVENDQVVVMNEGFFKSYYPDYQDTVTNQHQLLLYQEADDPAEYTFLQRKTKKREEKKRKKAEKTGQVYDEEENDDAQAIQIAFGGPESLFQNDIPKELEAFLDSTKFKKFAYNFGNETTYLGRRMTVIHFETKGTYDQMKQKGRILLDVDTDAIATFEYDAEIIIPLMVKPLLFAFGLNLREPSLSSKVNYQFANGKWYPQLFYTNVSMQAKKRYLFARNDAAAFRIQQILSVNEIETNGASQIPVGKRVNFEEKLPEQIQPEEGITWNNVQVLIPEGSQ